MRSKDNKDALKSILGKKRGLVYTYDRSSLPASLTMRFVLKLCKDEGILLYDSKLGSAPQLIDLGGGQHLKNVKIIDINEQ